MGTGNFGIWKEQINKVIDYQRNDEGFSMPAVSPALVGR
jgi:hypothetical protein